MTILIAIMNKGFKLIFTINNKKYLAVFKLKNWFKKEKKRNRKRKR